MARHRYAVSVMWTRHRTIARAAAVIAVAVHAASLTADDGLTTLAVVRKGDPVPTLPGFTFTGPNNAALNDSGDILYSARITGDGVTSGSDDVLLFGNIAEPTTNHVLIAREGGPVNGLPGFIHVTGSINLPGFYDLTVTPAGDIGYTAGVWQVGVSTVVLDAIIAGPPTDPRVALYNTGPAPGFLGDTVADLFQRPAIHDGAQLGMLGRVLPANVRTIWFGSPTSGITAALQTNLQAPGLPIGVKISNIDDGSLTRNALGTIAFHATLPLGQGVTQSNRVLLYEGPPDNVGIIARTGDPAHGIPGATYTAFDPDSLRTNAQGSLCYKARVTGGGTDEAIFTRGASTTVALVKDNDPVPSLPGLTFQQLYNARIDINGISEVAFSAILGGAPFASDSAIFIASPGNIRMVLREGDPLPGGHTAPHLMGAPFFFNDRGQFVFELVVNERSALFATRPDGEMLKLARGTEVLVTDDGFAGVPGALATFSYDRNARTAGNGNTTVFNNNGQLVITGLFSGSTGPALIAFDISDPCTADVTEPFGTLDIDDILTFLNAFAAGDPVADVAPPTGTLDIDDVLTFLSAFAAGCP